MAEFLSAYPTAGGQYHWVAYVSPHPVLLFCTRLLGLEIHIQGIRSLDLFPRLEFP